MDGKTIVDGWGYDSERCPHTQIKQFPKLYCKLCMAVDIDAALAHARQEEREGIIELCWNHICKGGHDLCDCQGEIITAIRARRP